MVPIPGEADEEARRAYREREDLTGEGRSIVNKIDGILATFGIKGYKALRRDRREQLTAARQPDGDRIPQKAKARIERSADRLELVLKLIEQVESARDPVLKKDAPADEAKRMIRSLTDLRSIGADFATRHCHSNGRSRMARRSPTQAGCLGRRARHSVSAAKRLCL